MMHVLDENQTKLKNVGFEKNKGYFCSNVLVQQRP